MSESGIELMPFWRRNPQESTLPQELTLEPNQEVLLEVDKPILSAEDMERQVGFVAPAVARLSIGRKELWIIDTRDDPRAPVPFYIVDETLSYADKRGYKALRYGETVTLGREHHSNRFNFPPTTSRSQVEVSIGEHGLKVANLTPLNPTKVLGFFKENTPQVPLPKVLRIIEDNRTDLAEERAKGYPNYGDKDENAPYGYILNHPILGRDSPNIDGGVSLGGTAREAIVVDGKSGQLRLVYEPLGQELLGRFRKGETTVESIVLSKVMRRVQEVMPYSTAITSKLQNQHYNDSLVGLSEFVKEGGGVCRHQGLLAAFLIERLIENGILPGTVGVERNTVPDQGGTHFWAIYKTVESAIVIDPAQGFVGTKQEANRQGHWEYRLSTDH